jgi:hypothetical protein
MKQTKRMKREAVMALVQTIFSQHNRDNPEGLSAIGSKVDKSQIKPIQAKR